MSTYHDVLQLKTDAELRFFVENPGYYQPELVDAAHRELRRRGPAAQAPTPAASTAAPPAAAPMPPAAAAPVPLSTASTAPPLAAAASVAPPTVPTAPVLPAAGAYPLVVEEAPAHRPWLLLGSIAAVLVVGGLGFWHKTPHRQVAVVPKASPKPLQTRAQVQAQTPAPAPGSLKLETAVAFPLPTYDTEAYVEKALALLPAAEQKDAPHADQYRAISRCFWAAQNPSAHLIRQAQHGEINPMLEAQARSVLDMWYNFERTQVYSYKFEPGMADHLARMKVIAKYQREALGELANNCAAQRAPVLNDDQILAHQQAVPTLLAPLEHKTGSTTVQL